MMTHADMIDRWPSLRTFADDVGVPYGTAQVMRWRGSIHPRHWARVAAAARRRGIRGVNVRTLSEIAAAPPPIKPRRPKSHRQEAVA